MLTDYYSFGHIGKQYNNNLSQMQVHKIKTKLSYKAIILHIE